MKSIALDKKVSVTYTAKRKRQCGAIAQLGERLTGSLATVSLKNPSQTIDSTPSFFDSIAKSNPLEKVCLRCGEPKSLPDFHRYTQSKDGRQPWCKLCKLEWERENRDKRLTINKRYQKKHPVAHKAHIAVGVEVRAGRLSSSPCMLCGKKRTEGHHPDPTKLLYVVWLCRRCHHAVHSGISLPSDEAAA